MNGEDDWMDEVSHEPLLYTNQPQTAAKVFSYILMLIFGLPAVAALSIGVYWLFLGNDLWIASIFLIPVGLLLGLIAWVAYDQNIREKEIKYEFVLNEKGIQEKRYYLKKNKIKENHIVFEDMDKVLVGNYVDRMPGLHTLDYYKFGVLVIIMYKNNYFFQCIYKADEFNEWLIRLVYKNVPVYYTSYDLKQSFIDQTEYDVDFSKIIGVPWEDIETLPPIEYEMASNPFTEWQDEQIETLKKNAEQKNTSRMDRYVTSAIFLYAFFAGGVIMPQLPLGSDGMFVVSDLWLLAVLLVNLIIPITLVYWRSYTKWYMPLIYFLVASVGNSVALFLVGLLSSVPPLYGSVVLTNVVLLIFLWYPALIIMKIAKMIFSFIYKHNLL